MSFPPRRSVARDGGEWCSTADSPFLAWADRLFLPTTMDGSAWGTPSGQDASGRSFALAPGHKSKGPSTLGSPRTRRRAVVGSERFSSNGKRVSPELRVARNIQLRDGLPNVFKRRAN